MNLRVRFPDALIEIDYTVATPADLRLAAAEAAWAVGIGLRPLGLEVCVGAGRKGATSWRPLTGMMLGAGTPLGEVALVWQRAVALVASAPGSGRPLRRATPLRCVDTWPGERDRVTAAACAEPTPGPTPRELP